MSLLSPPAPDFNDPLALLAACHQRILGFCDLLERLGPWIDANGLDKEALDGARSVIRYFSRAAQLHHDDEEFDLFPLLRGDEALNTLLYRLQQEHRELERHWAVLAKALYALLRHDYDAKAYAAAMKPFCAAYRQHIRDENDTLLPRAGEWLSEEQRMALGRSMAARRRPPE